MLLLHGAWSQYQLVAVHDNHEQQTLDDTQTVTAGEQAGLATVQLSQEPTHY